MNGLTPLDRDRLMRMETLLETFTAEMRRYCETQKEHNDIFFATTAAVANMKSQARGAWWTIGIFGSLTVAVSTGVAWATEMLMHRGGR